MSIEKAKLKVLVADEIGGGLGKALQEAVLRVREARGQATALAAVQDEVKAVSQAVVANWKEGKIVLNAEDPMAVPKHVTDVLMTLARRIHDRAENAAQSVLRVEGEVNGLRFALQQVDAMRTREEGKALALANAEGEGEGEVQVEGGNGGPRRPGAHPGPTLKAQRQAEEASALPQMNIDAPMPKVKPPRKAGRGSKKATRATNA